VIKPISDYSTRLRAFLPLLAQDSREEDWRGECVFESLQDESNLGGVDETLSWYESCLRENQMVAQVIPLAECRQWAICPRTGSLVHESGEFFRVDGVRVRATPTREVEHGWDQPLLTQVGYDGGILGLLRKRFGGVPHYLVEAKAEPGNFNVVQITTTVQATFSNLQRAHKGNATPYAEYFTNPVSNRAKVIFDIWMSEDGGRLNNKRNRTMLVEHDELADLPVVAGRYRWVSLFQLRFLLRTRDAIVSPHIRGVLAVV
jgi:oxidase EvaA